MAAKTDKKANNTLPLNTDDPTPSSNITYNSEVVASIAGLAANEVEGIAGMCSVSGSIAITARIRFSRTATAWKPAKPG